MHSLFPGLDPTFLRMNGYLSEWNCMHSNCVKCYKRKCLLSMSQVVHLEISADEIKTLAGDAGVPGFSSDGTSLPAGYPPRALAWF